MIVRLTLALIAVLPAAMAYPWRSTVDWWLFGTAVAVVAVVFARWRGLFLTTLLGRRIALWRRRGHDASGRPSPESATVALRVRSGEVTALPVRIVAAYLDRYGVRLDTVRVVSRDLGGVRTSWIGLTLAAAGNIAALQARSSSIPVHDTVAVAARRLADHLRELGWHVVVDEAPVGPVSAQAVETWRGMRDDQGVLAAYRIAADDDLADTLAALWASGSTEIWTVLQLTGGRTHPEVTVACAVRTPEKPDAGSVLPGLALERGVHLPALTAMRPASGRRLSAAPVQVPPAVLADLHWPIGLQLSRTSTDRESASSGADSRAG